MYPFHSIYLFIKTRHTVQCKLTVEPDTQGALVHWQWPTQSGVHSYVHSFRLYKMHKVVFFCYSKYYSVTVWRHVIWTLGLPSFGSLLCNSCVPDSIHCLCQLTGNGLNRFTARLFRLLGRPKGGLMFYRRCIFFFLFATRSPRSRHRSPWNFATWSESGLIL